MLKNAFIINSLCNCFYSGCRGEWVDCVSEDEHYLRNKTKFYETCNFEMFQSGGDIDLESASDNECFTNRCSKADGDEPYVGYDPDGTCTCEATKEMEPDDSPNYYTRQYNLRLTRQTSQIPTKAGNVQRVQVSANGRRQIVTDRSAGYRTQSLAQAQKGAKLTGRRPNEEDVEADFEEDFEI